MTGLSIQDEITGGESVYCINRAQMGKTRDLVAGDTEQGRKLRALLADLEESLSRNEQAALAFTMIERLNKPV